MKNHVRFVVLANILIDSIVFIFRMCTPSANAYRAGGEMSSVATEIDAAESPWALVLRRLTKPCRQFTFYVFLVFGILAAGYLAVWIEAWHAIRFVVTPEKPSLDLEPLKISYATAIIAVAGPCIMQTMLSRDKIAIGICFIVTFCVVCITKLISSDGIGQADIHVVGAAGVLVSIFSWWLANGDDDLFQDKVNPYAASGGKKLNGDLPGGMSKVKT